MSSLFANIPNSIDSELFEDIVKTNQVRIERIVSFGQSSPEEGWYDQNKNEWVMVISGFGIIEYPNGKEVILKSGDYLNIPAHQKHRVKETSKEEPTVWLAVFY